MPLRDVGLPQAVGIVTGTPAVPDSTGVMSIKPNPLSSSTWAQTHRGVIVGIVVSCDGIHPYCPLFPDCASLRRTALSVDRLGAHHGLDGLHRLETRSSSYCPVSTVLFLITLAFWVEHH